MSNTTTAALAVSASWPSKWKGTAWAGLTHKPEDPRAASARREAAHAAWKREKADA